MCVVSRNNNYIFFHIPKCGGTSINQILPNKEKTRLIDSYHIDYTKTKLIFSENNELNWFNKSNKFAVIRNPFDRVISLYCYIKQQTDHHLHNRIINHDFTQFCYFLKNIGNEFITSCYQHLCDEDGFIDNSIRIFKLEEINNNLEEISDIIKIKINEIPHLNKSDFFYNKTNESDLLIKEIFFQDLDIFYEELL
jgi:hypothetical protein